MEGCGGAWEGSRYVDGRDAEHNTISGNDAAQRLIGDSTEAARNQCHGPQIQRRKDTYGDEKENTCRKKKEGRVE